ncbi:acyl-CoA dehydrogenase family protein [Saccharothrix obliqua]|uniref:acyl-CoA dehydrogenase family protein n=1 Tax=Saccharothrix obliqua TaxID=2861747 RepID=UPI001C5E2AC2|nr:acyl-CoA dehydrogenase family protein [Saccharothrix obliqua]MBW4716735.1 acyl-CoA dehydrogenase [Saccharothrix obliqua]
MTTSEFTAVLEAARDIVPTLRENGRASEDQRWIVDENVRLLEKSGVLRAAAPKRYGGLDLPLGEAAKLVAEVASGCGSTGWVTMVWVSNTWLVTLFPDQAQDEVFGAGPSARISGGFTPSGVLTPVDGGYRLSGTWRFNSGCRGADWNMAASVLHHADGTEEEVMALVPMSEFTIADDWDTFAAAGTGSASSTLDDVFVPAHRVVTFEHALTDTTPGRAHLDPSRRYGLFPVVFTECAMACVGIARGALDLFLKRIPGRPITYTSWTDQRQHPLTQVQVATAANKIAAAEGLAEGWWRLLQGRADEGGELTPEERAVLRGETAFAIQLAKEAVEILYGASGASVLQKSVPMQRFFRDIEGFSQHALLLASTNLEVQGRVLLGLDPETPFL